MRCLCRFWNEVYEFARELYGFVALPLNEQGCASKVKNDMAGD